MIYFNILLRTGSKAQKSQSRSLMCKIALTVTKIAAIDTLSYSSYCSFYKVSHTTCFKVETSSSGVHIAKCERQNTCSTLGFAKLIHNKCVLNIGEHVLCPSHLEICTHINMKFYFEIIQQQALELYDKVSATLLH